ncbi:MAG: hypothetical protein ABH810_00520 [bacterium]
MRLVPVANALPGREQMKRREYDDPKTAYLVVKCFVRGKRIVLDLIRRLSVVDRERLMEDLWEAGCNVWAQMVLIALPLDHKAYRRLRPDDAERVTRIVVGFDPIPVY